MLYCPKQILIVAFLCLTVLVANPSCGEESKTSIEPSSSRKAAISDDSHPLLRVIELATQGLQRADQQIDDYSCIMIKRERIDGKLTPRQYMEAKVRHRKVKDGKPVTPLSIYLKFLKPSSVQGREVLYVEGERKGDLIARRGGSRYPNLTVELKPRGHYAMRDNRHPITDFGFRTLVAQLIANMRQDLQTDGIDVKFYDNAKLGDRECQHIQVTKSKRKPTKSDADNHKPQQTKYFEYHVARMFIDKEMLVPVYFASYGWPDEQGGDPPLNEEYIFTKISLNPGFSDSDFDASNPSYGFDVPSSHDEAIAIASE